MTLDEVQEQGLEVATDSPAEPWAERIPQLRDEIAKLSRLMDGLGTEEKEAQEQIQSLTYAADLTRDEAQRRARANTELSSAYEVSPSTAENDAQLLEVQRLEGELLNAKRDSANVVFEVEQLEFRLKKLREKTAGARLHGGVTPTSPALRSPQLTSLSSGNAGSIKISPLMRPSRLIGDVDSLVVFAEDGGDKVPTREHAPCRLGVGASGHMALYSYASAMPLLYLDDRNAKTGELEESDVEALRGNMDSVDLQIAGSKYELCGLRESVAASMQLIQDASQLLRTDDEEIEPQE